MIVLKIYNKLIQDETDQIICIAKGFTEDCSYFYLLHLSLWRQTYDLLTH